MREFTDVKATCRIIGEDSFVMLLVENFFKTFAKKVICDATKSTEAIIALSAASREKVDEMMNKVIEAGGIESRDPEDHGWMYGRSFQDLDGHLWEILFMDESTVNQN